jgi:hypothetical protein
MDGDKDFCALWRAGLIIGAYLRSSAVPSK